MSVSADAIFDRIRRFVEHPATIITAALGLVAQFASIPGIDAVAGAVWSNAGLAWGLITALQSPFAPDLPVLSEGLLGQLATIAVVIFILRSAYKIGKSAYKRFKE